MSGTSGLSASSTLVADSIHISVPGGRTLVDRISLALNPGDKLGVIGAEGTGKSSLLAALAGQMPKGLRASGRVERPPQVALLEQTLEEGWQSHSVVEFLLLDTPGTEIPLERWNTLQDSVASIIEVGLDPAWIHEEDRPLHTLSGGERVRLRIAKLLQSQPDLWLLDEPTNDLDIPTLEWLEGFLLRTESPVAFISHDETLLDRCANRILYFQRLVYTDRTEVRLESMGYLEFVGTRARQIEKQEQEAANQRRERARAERVLREHKSRVQSAQEKIKDSSARRLLNKKMKVITTREAKLERNPTIERPEDVEAIQIDFPNACRTPEGKTVLQFELPTLSAGPKTLARDIRLRIRGPEKVAIIGRNGAGKTTLVRAIAEHLRAAGSEFGYFPQEHDEELTDPNRRAIDYVVHPERGVDMTMAGILMARLNIARDEVVLPVKELSGGQRAKIVLLRILSGSGFLLLDEPTRNLSPLSNRVLRRAFRDHPGALLAVTHDRAFVSEVADRVLELTPEGLSPLH